MWDFDQGTTRVLEKIPTLKRCMGAKIPGTVVEIPPSGFAINEASLNQLIDLNLVGLSFVPVLIEGMHYFVCRFVQSDYKLDFRRTFYVEHELSLPSFPTKKGLLLDINLPANEDCFMPQGMTYRLVNETAISAFEQIFPDWFTFTALHEHIFYELDDPKA